MLSAKMPFRVLLVGLLLLPAGRRVNHADPWRVDVFARNEDPGINARVTDNDRHVAGAAVRGVLLLWRDLSRLRAAD